MLNKIKALYAQASKNRLAKNMGGAFVVGSVGMLVKGESVKMAAAAGAALAGTALINFIQQPQPQNTDAKSADVMPQGTDIAEQ